MVISRVQVKKKRYGGFVKVIFKVLKFSGRKRENLKKSGFLIKKKQNQRQKAQIQIRGQVMREVQKKASFGGEKY